MRRSTFRLHVVTEPDRLYCGHMTVYPGGHKERLHGHNFQLFLDIDLADGSMARMVDLDVFRHALADICAAWKERLLLPATNPYLQVVAGAAEDAEEIEFRLCGKRYVIPRDEVVLLPIENVSVEGLSEHAAELLRARVADAIDLSVVRGFELRCEELPGIGASYAVVLGA